MEYLLPLFSIIMINILLSGDNALVIALASRKLTPKQQKAAMIWGSAGAIGLRIGLTFIAILILKIPYLQMAGGLLLLWIAIKLIADQKHHEKVGAKKKLWDAVKTIIVADVVMSLDNVIAIIGIAKGNTILLVIGLAISIPIIIWGSKAIGIFIQKWPRVITIGSVFLGWTAGEMVIADRQLLQIVEWYSWIKWVLPSIFVVIVVVVGKLISNKE
ncbi:MAG: integral rane protein, YjbE family [Firmicutes bacterium]|nr:integral rane protein, YjbE family [Bacillota bacterium]